MVINFFTIILGTFVFLMFIYLFLVRRSIIIKAVKRSGVWVIILFVSFIIFLFSLSSSQTMDQLIRGILSATLALSFLLDAKGLSDDKIILSPFDSKGVNYTEIDEMVLLLKSKEIRMNYFKNGRRGPMLKFNLPLEELLAFLSKRLNEHAEINIIFEEEN